MEKHHNKFITYFMLTSVLILSGLIFAGTLKTQKEVTPIADSAKETVSVPKEEREEILSPDGKHTLVVQKLPREDGSFLQTFSLIDEGTGEMKKIHTSVSSDENYLTVPYNTFSPTNKYVFLKVNNGSKNDHIVLRTDGVSLSEENVFAEVEKRFYTKYATDFKVTAVTGWGGNGLLVINTDFADGKTGPSFWFDLSNLSFIRLSNRFN